MAQSNSVLSKMLEELEGITELIDNADKIKKDYISLISQIKKTKKLGHYKLSEALGCFLDPKEGYIALARESEGLSLLVADTLKLKNEIPKHMVPQIERLEECVDKAKQALQEMRIRLEPLFKEVEDCIAKDKPVTKKVRRKLRVIICFRDTCKDFLKKADKAISDIYRMVVGILLLCLGCTVLTAAAVGAFLACYAGVAATGAATGTAATGAATAAVTGTGATATGAAAAGAAATGAAAAGAAATGAQAPGVTATGIAAAGVAIAGTIACCYLFIRFAKYAHWFNEVQSECEKKLNSVRDNLDELKRKVEVVEEELEDSAQ